MSILHRMRVAAKMAVKAWNAPSSQELLEQDAAQRRALSLRKAANLVSQTSKRYYMTEEDERLANEYKLKRLATDPMRRAIYSVNSYLNIFGIPRPNFWKDDNDRLARNAIYAVCEKRIMDTVETLEWDVTDSKDETVDTAVNFLKKPNPQDTFQTLIKQTLPDSLRYDQAVWVKTRNIAGYLMELKAYSGPEFWIEVDDAISEVSGQYGLQYYGPWSHGYVKRYWQHSRPGVYIPFSPKDICFHVMYKRADSIYGTDFLQQLKWQLEYMIDSTKAAGMTFANGVGPSLIWKHGTLTNPEQMDEKMMAFELENKGAENFGNIMHIFQDDEISTIFPQLMHMQWLEGQRFISSIIWAMFGFAESEFTSNDVNRATAYVNQNITKSKMLAPLLKHLETVINTEVLPELEGYQEGWTFAFKPIQEIDDKLKEAEFLNAQANVVKAYVDMNVPIEEAMRLAKVDEDNIRAITEALDSISDAQNQSMEDALQHLREVNGLPPAAIAPPPNQAALPPGTGNPPDQGGLPHKEGYTGQARNDSGKPEDDGQPDHIQPKKLPFGKASLEIEGTDPRKESDYDPDQLKAGIKVESEHTDNPDVARKIAMDHLDEDKEYYIKLRRMEAKKADFVESEHPRAEDGRFGDKPGVHEGKREESSKPAEQPKEAEKPKGKINKIEDIQTSEEAERFVYDNYPDMSFTGIEKVPIEIFKAHLNEFNKLSAKFPQLKDEIDEISFTEIKDKEQALAACYTYTNRSTVGKKTGRRLEFNTKYFSSLDELKNVYKDSSDKGWNVAVDDPVLGIFAHEYGHVLQQAMTSAFSGKFGDKAFKWLSEHKPGYGELSMYAQTSPEEAFAEGFAVIMHGMSRDALTSDYVKAQRQLIQEYNEWWGVK